MFTPWVVTDGSASVPKMYPGCINMSKLKSTFWVKTNRPVFMSLRNNNNDNNNNNNNNNNSGHFYCSVYH